MSLLLFSVGCLIAISYGHPDDWTTCQYEIDDCVPTPATVAGGVQLYNKSILCECGGTTLDCVQSIHVLDCNQPDPDLRIEWAQKNSICCPAPSGCCIGTTSKCDTVDKTVCDRASTCEWKTDEVNCPVPAPTPPPVSDGGCCFGVSSRCNVGDDEAKCGRMSDWDCYWISGHDADCSTDDEVGCCFGEDSLCVIADAASNAYEQCNRMSAKSRGCEWRSGEDADCSEGTSSGGSTSGRGG